MATANRNLGELVLNALRTAVTDPEVRRKADEATAGLESLTARVDALARQMEDDDALDASQSEELAGIQSELQSLADALSGGVIEEVEPVQDPAEDTV